MNFTFGGISKKALPNTRSLRLSLFFFIYFFIVVGFVIMHMVEATT